MTLAYYSVCVVLAPGITPTDLLMRIALKNWQALTRLNLMLALRNHGTQVHINLPPNTPLVFAIGIAF